MIALALFDLLPEAVSLAHAPPRTLLAVAGLGFFVYATFDRLLFAHGEAAPKRGWAGAGSLSAHSFMDGLALGIGFGVSMRIGVAVAVAILAHDCSDGMSTVSLVLKNGGTRRAAFRWLLVDAVAPLAGAAASLGLKPSVDGSAMALCALAGFFLYIGASDLLPDSFRGPAKLPAAGAMLAGAALLYAVVRLAG